MGGKSSKKKSEAPAAPLDFFADGAIIYLKSKASGKLLRVHEDKVDASGEEQGESAQFTVHKKESESGHVVTLQNGEKYLKVSEEEVGVGEEGSELKVVEAKGGVVSFESVATEGRYISVEEDGSVKTSTEVGTSTYFTPSSAEEKKKEEEAEAQPAGEEAKEGGESEEPAGEKQEETPAAAEATTEGETTEQKEEEEGQAENETVEENKEEAPSDS